MSLDNKPWTMSTDKFNCQMVPSDEKICKKILSQCEHYLNSYIKFLVPPQESCCEQLARILANQDCKFSFPPGTRFKAIALGDDDPESGKEEEEAPTTPLVKEYGSPKMCRFAEINEKKFTYVESTSSEEEDEETAKKEDDEERVEVKEEDVPYVVRKAPLLVLGAPRRVKVVSQGGTVYLPEPTLEVSPNEKLSPITFSAPTRPKYTTQVSTMSQKSNTLNLYSCWPPPIGIIMISILEIILYFVNEKKPNNSDGRFSHGIIADYLMFDPYRRKEAWRFITYLLVHIGLQHLLFNLGIQIFLGVILEMVHQRWRVLTIYFAGILAGSLGASVFNPTVKLAGASSGVYALITAHIVTVILKWKHVPYPAAQLMIFMILTFADFLTGIYAKSEDISYAAHACGALAGFLVGFQILRKLSADKKIRWFQNVGFVAFLLFVIFCVCWNIFATEFFPKQVV